MKTGAARRQEEWSSDFTVRRAALVSSPQNVIPKRSEGSPAARLTGQNFLTSGLGAASSLH